MDVQQSYLDLDRMVDRTVTQTLIDSEIPLPQGRDAAEVLSACAHHSGMEAVCQDGEVLISGKLEMELLCRQLSGDTFGFTAASAFFHQLEMAESDSDMTAVVTAQIVECSCTAEAGKLRLSAILELHILLLSPVKTPFVTGITGCACCESRSVQVPIQKRALLASHSMRLREEVAASDASAVLVANGAAEIRAISFSGNAASVEGLLHITALTASEDGTLQTVSEAIPFSDVFDAPACDTVWGNASVDQLHVIAADPGFGVVDVEAVLAIRLYGVRREAHEALADAYATDASFRAENMELVHLGCLGGIQRIVTVNEPIAIPKHLPDAYGGIYATVTPAVTNTYDADGRFGVDAMLLVTVLYRCDAGKLHCFTEDIPIQFSFDAPYTAVSSVTLTCLRCQISGTGRTLSLTVNLCALAERYTSESICLTREIVAGSATPAARGVVIYCAGAGETLWDVGKRYLVPVAQLLAWNEALSDPLPEGKQVVLLA